MFSVKVHVATLQSPLIIECSSTAIRYAEDLCLLICKRNDVKISPLARSLFALRKKVSIKKKDDKGKDEIIKYYLSDGARLDSDKTKEYEFRIRYKVCKPAILQFDENAYNYFFWQLRNDILKYDEVPEIVNDTTNGVLFGLGVTDMCRAIKVAQESGAKIAVNYKEHIHKIIRKKHGLFTPIKIKEMLEDIKLKDLTIDKLKEAYIDLAMKEAPNYLSEVYDVIYSDEKMKLEINPFRKEHSGLLMKRDTKSSGCNQQRIKDEDIHIGLIQDLCFIEKNSSRRTVNINRTNGKTIQIEFITDEQLDSFISCCCGYYRLMLKWNFKLCVHDITPSLNTLITNKWHGPVGEKFAYNKLKSRMDDTPGCYLVRESEDRYDHYYLDVYNKNQKIETYEMNYNNGQYVLSKDSITIDKFDSFNAIVTHYSSINEELYLREIIPSSIYDNSQLLLCGDTTPKLLGQQITHAQLEEALKANKSPLVIKTDNVIPYFGDFAVSASGVIESYKSTWTLEKNKRIIVQRKVLKEERRYLLEFIDLANKMTAVSSEFIVKLYGVTLGSPPALVMEYLPYGTLDKFLQSNKGQISSLKLLKITVNLSRALWDMTEAKCIHGRIRCYKILITQRDRDAFHIKLSDPGIYNYDRNEYHWIPVDYHSKLELAKKSLAADTWAFATTVWEIFSYGETPCNSKITTENYMSGDRLKRPEKCDNGVWQVLRKCWLTNINDRPDTQSLMRDLSHILSPDYISTECHTNIVITETDLPERTRSFGSQSTVALFEHPETKLPMQSVLDLKTPSRFGKAGEHLGDVVPREEIGRGHFGIVYKGILEYKNNHDFVHVAIKKMKKEDYNLEEKNIMSEIDHPNIVRILGICHNARGELLIVMEYMENGSLDTFLKHKRPELTNTDLLSYAKQIASGMNHLILNGIVHRDLAARNILVANKDSVKISDFGMAKKLGASNSMLGEELPICWFAPEAIRDTTKFNEKTDVWSYGVTLWEIYTYGCLHVPPVDIRKLEERASKFTKPESCPEEVYTLMKCCLEYKPEYRPTFHSLNLQVSQLAKIL